MNNKLRNKIQGKFSKEILKKALTSPLKSSPPLLAGFALYEAYDLTKPFINDKAANEFTNVQIKTASELRKLMFTVQNSKSEKDMSRRKTIKNIKRVIKRNKGGSMKNKSKNKYSRKI